MKRDHHGEPAREVPDIDGEIFSDLFDRFWDATVCHDQTRQQVGVIARELQLAPGDRVLVLPAGAGRLALALASSGYSVLGIDPRPDAVASCAMLAARAGSTAEFRCADVDHPDRCCVAAAVCLDWPGSPEQLATLLSATLTAGGRALVDIGATGSCDGWAEELDRAGMVPLGHCADLWGQYGDPPRRAIVARRS